VQAASYLDAHALDVFIDLCCSLVL
jgi:hypothetical protein